MTAEVAVMNKAAVALAADSAVSISTQSGMKIYNTVNKLFTLSKYRPVGIMVYGNAELMGVPWETVIKQYRARLGTKSFSHLEDYSKDFFSFLDSPNELFPESQQIEVFEGSIQRYYYTIREDIDKEVKKAIDADPLKTISRAQVSQVVKKTIRSHVLVWRKFKTIPSLPKNHSAVIIRKFKPFINQASSKAFQKLPISLSSYRELREIATHIYTSTRFPKNHSGVVIAGFGEKDNFPVLEEFFVGNIINNRLKYYRNEGRYQRTGKVDFSNEATLHAFAQRDMVGTFMEGIDPDYHQILEIYLSRLFQQLPGHFVQSIPGISQGMRDNLNDQLLKLSAKILSDFWKEMDKYRRIRHTGPAISAIEALPKDELAAMAESLVNLTSFKRKISMDSETVGGPIDVAVISKADGFVWIKRKHYFKSELNPYFIANYFKVDGMTSGGKK